jgi:hypothetical protein
MMNYIIPQIKHSMAQARSNPPMLFTALRMHIMLLYCCWLMGCVAAAAAGHLG